MKTYIQVITNEILNPIIDSQVYRPLNFKSKTEVSVCIVIAILPIGLFLRPSYRSKIRAISKKRKNLYGIETRYVVNGTSKFKFTQFERLQLHIQLRRLVLKNLETVVLARNSTAMCSVMRAMGRLSDRCKLIFDCRGDIPSERVGGLGAGWNPKLWNPFVKNIYTQALEEEKMACGADEIIAVSQKMVEMLSERHGVPFSKFKIEPCKVDLRKFSKIDRSLARQHLNVGDRKVLCYLGSLAWYQLPDQSIRVFKGIKTHYPNSLFLALTTDVEQMKEMLELAGFVEADYIVFEVSSENVPKYLAAADLGLLLRENNPVNAVASPVKFSEYLACGVPVLLTSNIGDYSSLVVSERLGGIVDIAQSDSELVKSLADLLPLLEHDEVRYRCRSFAETKLSWSESGF